MRIVIEKKPYRGNAVGTDIEVSRQTARVLVAVGLASYHADAPVVAPEPPKPEKPKDEPREKRTYRRRDMNAGS